MTVLVNLLGSQREAAQTSRISIPFESRMRVADVFAYVQEKYPGLSLDQKLVLITVNQSISSFEQILKADDEVAFIPHIGGG